VIYLNRNNDSCLFICNHCQDRIFKFNSLADCISFMQGDALRHEEILYSRRSTMYCPFCSENRNTGIIFETRVFLGSYPCTIELLYNPFMQIMRAGFYEKLEL